ncbi:hypothetical protein [Xylanibacter rodentium]|uniref:hypothetical protein n=1 Tax=Xylanibacter rodentium TaxID=2736289 RepID=UPI00258EE6CA|nr:hypothetical protein [Xylanibacter rodentium]
MKTKANKTCFVIALMAMLFGGIQPLEAQGLLDLLKMAGQGQSTGQKTPRSNVGSSSTQTQSRRKTATNAEGKTVDVPVRPTKITALEGENVVSVTGMVINNVGMGKPVVRMRDAGIFLSNTGMSLIGTVAMTVKGQAGKRLIMSFDVLDENGEGQADGNGATGYLIPVQVPSNSYSCEVEVRIPYGWIDLQNKPTSFNFMVSMYDFGSGKEEPMIGSSVICMDPASIQVDGNAVQGQVLSDMFGGGSMGGMDLGGLMGAMFGGGTDTAEHTCVKCDGTGVGEYCDGDGFLNPSVCRKCAQNPGICRNCGGSGTTTVKLDIDRSRW